MSKSRKGQEERVNLARQQEHEWNFSPLEQKSSFEQWTALAHEIEREIARRHGHRLPHSWRAAVVSQPPPVIETLAPNEFQSWATTSFDPITHLALAIDWRQLNTDSDFKRAEREFGKLIRRLPQRPGRADAMTYLWNLCHYRLRHVFGLTYKNGAARLLDETGLSGVPGTASHAGWLNAVKRGRRIVDARLQQKILNAQLLAAHASALLGEKD